MRAHRRARFEHRPPAVAPGRSGSVIGVGRNRAQPQCRARFEVAQRLGPHARNASRRSRSPGGRLASRYVRAASSVSGAALPLPGIQTIPPEIAVVPRSRSLFQEQDGGTLGRRDAGRRESGCAASHHDDVEDLVFNRPVASTTLMPDYPGRGWRGARGGGDRRRDAGFDVVARGVAEFGPRPADVRAPLRASGPAPRADRAPCRRR